MVVQRPNGLARTAALIVALLTVAAMTPAALAVVSFNTGDQFRGRPRDHQIGYIAGAADMLAVLHDAGYIVPGRNSEAKNIIDCIAVRDLPDLRTSLMRHLGAVGRKEDDSNAASSFYVTMRNRCK